MGVETEERTEATRACGSGDEPGPALGAAFSAGADLLRALRNVVAALATLFASELRVLRASVAVVFLGSVALVAFSVSLWACVVALIGWTLMKATGSPGIALGLLVVLHLILVALIWTAIRRAIRHAGFPATRNEMRALGKELRGHVERFQRASAPRDGERTP